MVGGFRLPSDVCPPSGRLLHLRATFLPLSAVTLSALVLQAPLSAIGWGLLAALGMTFLATAIAVMAPLAHAYRANPADSLRGE